MSASELCDLSAVALRRMIGERALSPVDLVDACIARIEAVDPAVNAMVARDFERARRTAVVAEAAVMQGDPLGPLHGLPVAVKDLNPTAGLRTTWGSLLFKDHVPAADDGLVASVRRAGGIVIGKSNTPEFGAGANTTNRVYGTTGNPFDPRLTCAGSSGGSAVALACGMVPLATGTDMGGSLRTPASFCGVFGFRPSPGLVPAERRPLGWNPLSVPGPMARSAEDACLFMSALVRADAGDPLSSPMADPGAFAAPLPVALDGLRIAVSADLGFAPVSAAIRAVFEDRVARLAPLFGSIEVGVPPLHGADVAFDVMRATAFVAAYADHYRERRDQLGPNVVANLADGLAMTLEDVARAHAEQTRIYRAFQGFMVPYDLLLCPAAAVPPFPKGELYCASIDGVGLRNYFHWLALSYGVTLTGHPAASVPCGLGPTGMPFGLQLVGRRGADRFVLGAAHALERAMAGDPALARPRPDLLRLATG